jgi:3-oxoacyl-[acyl-carrier protein] reductase
MERIADRGCWAPELKGRTAIVTGAGRHGSIGHGIALELARQGVNLVLTGTGRDPASFPEAERRIGWRDIDSVAEEVAAAGAQALPVVSSVADPAAIDRLVAQAVEHFGGIDILVNNASTAVGEDRVPMVDLSLDEWDRVIDTNLRGAFLMSQAVARAMIARGQGGAILNISSVASRLGAANTGAYAISKAGLNTLSRVMAMELTGDRIRVNSVLPGLIDTSRIWRLSESDAWQQTVKAFVPLGVPGESVDIAWLCTFLCSDMGAWITGQDIAVDGGTSWH